MDGSVGPDGMLVGHTTWVAYMNHYKLCFLSSSKVWNEV